MVRVRGILCGSGMMSWGYDRVIDIDKIIRVMLLGLAKLYYC